MDIDKANVYRSRVIELLRFQNIVEISKSRKFGIGFYTEVFELSDLNLYGESSIGFLKF